MTNKVEVSFELLLLCPDDKEDLLESWNIIIDALDKFKDMVEADGFISVVDKHAWTRKTED